VDEVSRATDSLRGSPHPLPQAREREAMILKSIDIRCDECRTRLFEGGCFSDLNAIRKKAARSGWTFRRSGDARSHGNRIKDICPKCTPAKGAPDAK